MSRATRSVLLLPIFCASLHAEYALYPLFTRPTRTADFRPAFDVRLFAGQLAIDRNNNLYLAGDGGIRKITPDGRIEPFAGFGSAGLVPGDRIPAVLASPSLGSAMAADASGNLFVAGGKSSRQSIYLITPDRKIELYSTSPDWFWITGLSTDSDGNVYALVATDPNQSGTQVVRVAPDRKVTPLLQTDARAMVGDAAGNLYLISGQQIVRVDRGGTASTVSHVDSASGLALGPNGDLYVAQPDLRIVSRLAPDGTLTRVAGGVSVAPMGSTLNYSGDGGPATEAGLVQPLGLAFDQAGNMFIADGRLRKVDTNGIIRTVAGCACAGDGVPAFHAQVAAASGAVADPVGNIYFSDEGTHMVRRIAVDGTVTTVAGTGESGYDGDGGPARQARLAAPAGLAFDAAGNLYIADELNHRIRRVSPAGVIDTVAGDGVARFAGDGGPATAASLAFPNGVAVDAAGHLYIADTASHRVRKVTGDGIIQTIAGSDEPGLSGDGGPAALARFDNPRMLAFDRAGNLLVTDSAANVVRRITPAGVVARVAGTGEKGASGDGGPAISARVEAPWGITVDATGRILIGDLSNFGRIRAVDESGTIRTLTSGLGYGLAADPAGRIWIAGGNVMVASEVGLPFPEAPFIADGGITGGAMLQTSVVAPGEIVSIFGGRLGPQSAVGTSVSNGAVATSLAGTRVLFDGIPAPLLYVDARQINAVVPFGVEGKPTADVTVEVGGQRSNAATVAVIPAVPQLFRANLGTFEAAAALNQDGRQNRPGNAASAGSIVSLFATGAGRMRPAVSDGQVTGEELPRPDLPVRVSIGSRMLEVTYAGAAPGFVAGALQVNVRLPEDLATGYYMLALRVGDAISGQAAVFTQALTTQTR